MKELSTKEKAKAYDEAIERAKEQAIDGYLDAVAVKDIFPELRESEDEKIRKYLKRIIGEWSYDDLFAKGFRKEDIIAWLEKQGEQKSIKDVCDTCDEKASCVNPCPVKLVEQKPIDKIEPKFKIGDEIKTKNEESLIITRIDHWGYWSEDLFICNFDDADKWKLVEQKPAWSEEDIMRIDNLIAIIENRGYPDYVEYLEKLKYRVQPQPKQEWSEEDVRKMRAIVTTINSTPQSIICSIDQDRESLCNWLKSLKDRYTWKPSDTICNECEYTVTDCMKMDCFNKPQNRWKPSEQQLKTLQVAIDIIGEVTLTGTDLKELLEQLKKLREE